MRVRNVKVDKPTLQNTLANNQSASIENQFNQIISPPFIVNESDGSRASRSKSRKPRGNSPGIDFVPKRQVTITTSGAIKYAEKNERHVLACLEELQHDLPPEMMKPHFKIFNDLQDATADLASGTGLSPIQEWLQANRIANGYRRLGKKLERSSVIARTEALSANLYGQTPDSGPHPEHRIDAPYASSPPDAYEQPGCCECSYTLKNPFVHCRPSDAPSHAGNLTLDPCLHTLPGSNFKAVCSYYTQGS